MGTFNLRSIDHRLYLLGTSISGAMLHSYSNVLLVWSHGLCDDHNLHLNVSASYNVSDWTCINIA